MNGNIMLGLQQHTDMGDEGQGQGFPLGYGLWLQLWAAALEGSHYGWY